MRFESLRLDGLAVTEHEIHFLQLARHASSILLDEIERVCRFLGELTYLIHRAVFRAFIEGDSFESGVNAGKKAKLMDREEFGDPKGAY